MPLKDCLQKCKLTVDQNQLHVSVLKLQGLILRQGDRKLGLLKDISHLASIVNRVLQVQRDVKKIIMQPIEHNFKHIYQVLS